jgi:lycopene cyclase domain-containing protein
MNSLYLWLNIVTIAFPLFLSFDKKVAFYKNWKYLFPSIIITATFFIIWDQWFTQMKIWGFNAKYLTGYYLYEIPVEEVFFFVTVPYASVFIYETLKEYVKTTELFEDLYRWFTLLFFGITLTFLYWYNDKLYTAVTCVFLALVLGTHLMVIRRRYMSWLFLTFVVSIIPMLIINGMLTAKPVVYYDLKQQIGFRVGTIPIEDFLYNLLLLLISIGLYEWFKRLGHRSRLRPRKQSS